MNETTPSAFGALANGEGSAGSRSPVRFHRALVVLGLAASSAAVLILEISLTRVFAVTQFYHFAFLTVSLALLGFGASGSALAAFPRLGRGGPRRWALLASAQAVTTITAYLAINTLPFDSFSIAWDRRQIGYLAVYYLALAVPFFFGGAVIGALLAGWDQPRPIESRSVYGSSLVGAGGGCLVALWALASFGGVGAVAASASMAAVAATAFAVASDGWSWRTGIPVVLGAGLAAVMISPVDALDLRLSPYKDLSAALRYPESRTVSTRWSTAARVDHVQSAGIRSLPGLSFAYPGNPPPQDGLTFDGDDLSPIPLVGPAEAPFAPYLLSSFPFSLRSGGDALVLEPRGGLDVLVALAAGMTSVTAVEPNELAVEAALEANPLVYDDPRVRVAIEEPRAYVERTEDSFDLVDLALTAPYRPVTSGAYSLAEDYRLTAQAFDRYLSRLKPDGLLMAMSWVQSPPSEETRILALTADALRRAGVDPATAIVGMRGYSTALVVAKPAGFTDDELAAFRSFGESRRFDLFAAPGLGPDESNRFNLVPDDDYFALATSIVHSPNPTDVYRSYAFDIAPPTDDHPFFGHYFKWSQASDVLSTLGRTWQPFGGAGFFVLIALLVLSTVGAAALILAPLAIPHFRSSPPVAADPRGTKLWTLAYFGLLGIGFLFVEIPLIQQYILLVGRPANALAVVLFAILVASGMGSLWSNRMPWRATAVALALVITGYPFVIRIATDGILSAPLEVRMVVGGLLLIPLGFLMGTMFPKGLAHLERRAPRFVPWAWGINGTASVISASASALLALSVGFTFVVLLGALCYAGVAVLARSPAASVGKVGA